MVDDLDGLTDQADSSDTGEQAPSPEQSVGQAPSGEDWETRFKGLQRSLAERDREFEALRASLDEQRLALMPEDERDTFRQKQKDEEVRKLKLENELLKLQRDYPPEVFEAYTTLLSGKSAADQLNFLKSKLAAQTPPPPKAEPPAVSKNNPQRTTPKGTVLPDGTVMNATIADQILSAFTRVPRR